MTNEDGEEDGSDESGEITRSNLTLKAKKWVGRDDDGEGAWPRVDEGQDDDEANADLSLGIVAKAVGHGRKTPHDESAVVRNEDPFSTNPVLVSAESLGVDDNQLEDEDRVKGRHGVRARNSGIEEVPNDEQVVHGRLKQASGGDTPEEGELQEDVGEDETGLLQADKEEFERKSNQTKGKKKEKRDRKEKKENKKKAKLAMREAIEQRRRTSDNASVPLETKDADVQEQSIVMRRLLRGPRYFDPYEEQGQECFNCGIVGHLAASCPEGPRQKPCYVCGGFGHDGRECPQKTECFVCKNVGHIAKNCPNKGGRLAGARGDNNVCLLCGRAGHEASVCRHGYDHKDLEQVQCYICKNFGHLCCAVVVDSLPIPDSCYDCGEVGHSAARCSRSRWTDRRESGPVSVCFRCGEEGHYARGCSKRKGPSWPPPWSPDAQGLAGDNELAGPRHQQSRSVGGNVPRWLDLQQRESRWTSIRKAHRGIDDRWGGSSQTFTDILRDHIRVLDFNKPDVLKYRGPIEFDQISPSPVAPSPKFGYRNHRKRSWTSTNAR